jgi:hypothetical protein
MDDKVIELAARIFAQNVRCDAGITARWTLEFAREFYAEVDRMAEEEKQK